jgi:hypothetical protein
MRRTALLGETPRDHGAPQGKRVRIVLFYSSLDWGSAHCSLLVQPPYWVLRAVCQHEQSLPSAQLLVTPAQAKSAVSSTSGYTSSSKVCRQLNFWLHQHIDGRGTSCLFRMLNDTAHGTVVDADLSGYSSLQYIDNTHLPHHSRQPGPLFPPPLIPWLFYTCNKR